MRKIAFTHGENILGKHVDTIMEYNESLFEPRYPRYVRTATEGEKKEYCNEL